MIESKRIDGEGEMNRNVIRFKIFNNIDDDGSYSYKAGKYYWRLGNKVVFMIAFNTDLDETEQFNTATSLAIKMTENYVYNQD